MDVLLIFAGLALLFTGGEGLLRGSVSIAEKLGLSTLLVSMVIVGFGTSTPELMVSATAALRGAPAIALGNVVGSNIANILLILGASALIAPVACARPQIRRDALAVLVAGLCLAPFALTGMLGRAAGLALVVVLAAYLGYCIRAERKRAKGKGEFRKQIEEDVGKPALSLPKASALCVVALAFLAGGAHCLVEGATSLAEKFGIPDAVIGLTLVAVGTSLPELATAAVAAWRKHGDVVIGNIMGSNLFNTLGILGVTAAISPIPFEGRIAQIDVWIMIAVSLALYPAIHTGHKISRFEGGTFVALYLGYTVWLFASGTA